MANAFRRDLKAGDKIVLVDGRVATCGGECFGAMSFTTGTALDVTIEGEPGPVRLHAFNDVDAAETVRRFGKENGWDDSEELEARVRIATATMLQVREVYARVVNGEGDHGNFLRQFGQAVLAADAENFTYLIVPAVILIRKYKLE
jgi:hypothetical protein